MEERNERRNNNKGNSVGGDREEEEEEEGEPQMPVDCVTARDRYSWRKWLKCWRIVKDMNEKRLKAAMNLGREFKKDIWPRWDPTWKKRDGSMWTLELRSNTEQLDQLEERENAKIEFDGRPPYVEHNCDMDSWEWDNMSDPIQQYSSDGSFNSGLDYLSDF